MGPSPVYQKIITVKPAIRCPVFAKSPVSSASLFSYKWITRWPLNLSNAIYGTVQLLYAFLISIFFTSSTSGASSLASFQMCL